MNPSASEIQAQAQAHANPLSQTQFHIGREHAQGKEYAQVRERRHSTITALMDPELLMMHSVSKSETIPQTRQRLLRELLGCAVAVESEAIDDSGGHGSEDGGRRVSSNDEEGEKRLRQHGKRVGSGESDRDGRGGGSRDVTPKPRLRAQPRMQFGDQVVVNVVEREDGWVADPRGKGKGRVISGSLGSPSVSGSVSGEGSLRGVD